MIICFEQPDLDDTLLLRFPWLSPTSRGVTQATSAEQFPARHLSRGIYDVYWPKTADIRQVTAFTSIAGDAGETRGATAAGL